MNGPQSPDDMGDASLSSDPNMMPPMDNMGGDMGNPPMDDNMGNTSQDAPEMNPEVSELMDKINSLSDDDKEAAKKYIESMVKKDDSNNSDDTQMNDMGDDMNAGEQMPMQEFYKRINKILKENYNGMPIGGEDDDKKVKATKKVPQQKIKKAFQAPKFK